MTTYNDSRKEGERHPGLHKLTQTDTRSRTAFKLSSLGSLRTECDATQHRWSQNSLVLYPNNVKLRDLVVLKDEIISSTSDLMCHGKEAPEIWDDSMTLWFI